MSKILCILAIAAAAGPNPAGAENPQPLDASSNQALSLEDTAATSASTVEVEPPPPAEANSSPRVPSKADIADAAAAPQLIGGASHADTRERITASQPWYRTAPGASAIVLAVIAGLYWLARRYVAPARIGSSRAVAVVARSAITPKHTLALVRLGRRFVLVGVSGDRMQTLAEVDNADEAAELAAQTAAAGGGRFDLMVDQAAEAFEQPDREDENAVPWPLRSRPDRQSQTQARAPVATLLSRIRALQA